MKINKKVEIVEVVKRVEQSVSEYILTREEMRAFCILFNGISTRELNDGIKRGAKLYLESLKRFPKKSGLGSDEVIDSEFEYNRLYELFRKAYPDILNSDS